MTKTPKQAKSAFGEPWEVVHLDDDYAQLYAHDWRSGDLPTAKALRIAACVNFCRQFPTHWLETRQLHYAHPNTPLIDVPNQDGLVIVTRNDDQKRLNAEQLAANEATQARKPPENA